MEEVQQSEISLNSAKTHIAGMLKNRNELEKRLARTKATLDEHMVLEKMSLNKIQEMLQIVEVAMSEKSAAIQREQEIKGARCAAENTFNFYSILFL